MNGKPIGFAFSSLVLLAACAHQQHQGRAHGTVAMKINKQEAHVCIDGSALNEGDKVTFFRNECVEKTHSKGEYADDHCKKVRAGTGVVAKKLNEHYSLVKTDGSFAFQEGTMVEKE